MSRCALQEWPKSVKEWNSLSEEKKMQLLFYDEWLTDIHPDVLWYHYTTVDALLTMLTGKGVELWASHKMFVNDSEEIRLGARRIASLMKKNVSEDIVLKYYEGDAYIACLSLEKDSIPMWNTYGGGGFGIALGFKPHIPLPNTYFCARVIYSGTKAETEWLHKTSQQIMNGNKFDPIRSMVNLVYMPYVFKNKGFVYEKEIRLLCVENDSPVCFRTRKGMLVPYKKIHVDYANLSEIMIGPSADAARMQYAIELLLAQKGLNNVRVTRSQCPLKN